MQANDNANPPLSQDGTAGSTVPRLPNGQIDGLNPGPVTGGITGLSPISLQPGPTPDTSGPMANYNWNGAAGSYLDPTQWTPSDVPLYGADDVATISAGTATLSDTEPNNITLILGVQPGTVEPSPTLTLSNAALGPDTTLNAIGQATLGVLGYDTVNGQINVLPPDAAAGFPRSAALTIFIGAGSQLNQEGTIAVVSPQTVGSRGATLFISGSGTLNNDGQIYVGPGGTGQFGLSASSPYSVTGSGTITVDHATANLFGAASTQMVDLLGGTLNTAVSLAATIKDWNNDGTLTFNPSAIVRSVQFNQTSDAGGDLQLFGAAGQIGDLHLLGAYATSDFTVGQGRDGTSSITATGHAPLSA